jgi:hypothetical protein
MPVMMGGQPEPVAPSVATLTPMPQPTIDPSAGDLSRAADTVPTRPPAQPPIQPLPPTPAPAQPTPAPVAPTAPTQSDLSQNKTVIKFKEDDVKPIVGAPNKLQPAKPQTESAIPDEFKVDDTEWLKAQEQAKEIQDRQMAAQQEYKKEYASRLNVINSMSKDIQDYKVDPDYFWSGRPINKDKLSAARKEAGEKAASKYDKGEIIDKGWAGGGKLTREKQIKEAQESVSDREGGLSTGQKIGLVFASALASYASGLAGKDPLAGIKMIDDMLDRDLRKQQLELEKKKDMHQAEVNLLGQMRQLYQDDQAAYDAAKSFQWQQAKAMFDRMSFTAGRQDQAKEYKLALDKLKQDAYDKAENRKIDKQNADTARITAIGNLAKDDKGDRNSENDKLQTKQIEDMSAVFESLAQQKELIDSFTTMRKTGGRELGGRLFSWLGMDTAGSEYQAARANAIMRLAKAFGSNPTDKDAERTEALIPSPGDSLGLAINKLQQFKGQALGRLDEKIKILESTGYDPEQLAALKGQRQRINGELVSKITELQKLNK